MRASGLRGVAIGFFDGVHLGHQAILRSADAAVTFSPHPLSVLAPERAPRLIMRLEDRLAAIRACGVEDVTVLPFTAGLAALAPEAFVARAGLASGCRVLCGENWRFGRGGAGDAAWLRAHGIAVTVVPFAAWGGERVSSTRIRAALERGALADANAMLGRPFALPGAVAAGKGLGRELGFPTLNVTPAPDFSLRLPHGVYAAELAGARALANWGVAPTLGARAWARPVLEVHVLGEAGTLPAAGTEVLVRLHAFVRPERRFGSLEDLRRQIARDCATISA